MDEQRNLKAYLDLSSLKEGIITTPANGGWNHKIRHHLLTSQTCHLSLPNLLPKSTWYLINCPILVGSIPPQPILGPHPYHLSKLIYVDII